MINLPMKSSKEEDHHSVMNTTQRLINGTKNPTTTKIQPETQKKQHKIKRFSNFIKKQNTKIDSRCS